MVLCELLELFKMQHSRRQVGNTLDAKMAILLFKMNHFFFQLRNHGRQFGDRGEIHCGTDTYSRRS